MLEDYATVSALSKKYGIPQEDILLIAINACGIESDMPYKRIRFKFELNSKPGELVYLGVPVLNNSDTPFNLNYAKGHILFHNKEIGKIFDAENDTCDASYFRRNDTVLTLNSNSRSSCTGCAFCATHRQDATDKIPLDTEEKLSKYIDDLFLDPKKFGSTRPHFHKSTDSVKNLDFSNLYQVAVVTGCFGSEEEAIDHLKMVNKYFSNRGFNGEFLYIGSEITSEDGLKSLRDEIKNFFLCLSLECFTRREKLLKNIKAKLTLDRAKEVLEISKKLGILCSFTYIIGLDPLEDMVKGLNSFISLINRFPVFQVFQPHWEEHKTLRTPEAEYIDYYLKARKEIESMFIPTNLRPKPWQNYRPLWYFSFADEPINDIRI